MLPTFSQTLTLKNEFETAAQTSKELKKMELDGAFCKEKKTQILIDRFNFFLSSLNLKKKNGGENDSSKEK